MKNSDLEYIFTNNPNKRKNVYEKGIMQHLPDIHLQELKKNNIKYRFNPAKHRYLRSIDILRKDESIIASINPPHYSTNSKFSSNLVRDKMKTENYLRDHDIRTPTSYVFNYDEMEDAKSRIYSEGIDRAVIKPLHGTLGKGVMVDVREDRFKENWEQMEQYLTSDKKVIVQEYLEGFEARALVIEGNLISVTVRTPPFVIGDGVNSIDELINLSNVEKSNCHIRKNLLIKKNDRLQEYLIVNELKLEDVPEKGEYVLLGSVSNVSNGGELVNITDVISDEIKEIALNSVACINGMYTAGIDIMMKSYDDQNPVVIEINAFPVLYLSAFPTYGAQSKPAQTFLRSVIAVDQFRTNTQDKYHIENEEDYVRNYLSFVKRKDNLYNKNYKNHARHY